MGRRVRPELGQELRNIDEAPIALQEGARMMRRYFERARDASIARADAARTAAAGSPP